MENKSKVFTKKLVALFLAVVMAVTALSGVFAASAKSTEGYHDEKLAGKYNYLAWTEPTSNQTAEALLDLVERVIQDLKLDLNLQTNINYGVIKADINIAWPHIDVYVTASVVANGSIKIDAWVDSIDGVIDLLIQLDRALRSSLLNDSTVRNLLGDIPNLVTPLETLAKDTTASTSGVFTYYKDNNPNAPFGSYTDEPSKVVSRCGKSWRANANAQDIVAALINTVKELITDSGTGAKLLNGGFSLGEAVENMVLKRKNLYNLISGLIGGWGGWQNDLAYNAVAAVLLSKTDWFTKEEIESFALNKTTGQFGNFEFDRVLMNKLSTELLQKINVLVTYPDLVEYTSEYPYGKDENGNDITGYFKDSSARRRFYIDKQIEENNYLDSMTEDEAYAQACADLGYDANLVYSDEYEGNVLLFVYRGLDSFEVKKTDTLYDLAFPALKLAWKTVIEPTLGLVQVNPAGGYFYDNDFYSWKYQNYGWSTSNVAANYKDGNTDYVDMWCNEVYANYNFGSAAEMKSGMQDALTFDRSVVSNPKYNWRDIDVTTLFNELRYSPLADLYFDMQTGPLNLYLSQTGYNNIRTFINTKLYNDTYSGIVEGIYDFLAAAVKDLFPRSAKNNIGYIDDNGNFQSLTAPWPAEIGDGQSNNTIANKTVESFLKIFEYVGNATNRNIFNGFYHKNNITISNDAANLTQSNLEYAVIPFAVAALKQWNLTASVHDTEWDKAKDIEAIGAIALNEHLGYLFPSRDYSTLWSYDNDGNISATLDGTIYPMVRDALGYLFTSLGVPVYKTTGNRNAWNPYVDSAVPGSKGEVKETSTTLFDLLNGIICYYLGDEKFDANKTDAADSVGKGYGAVIGLVGSNNAISTSRTLWQNVDLVANRLFPVLGTLQNGNSGQFRSEDLLKTQIIVGLADMGANGGGLKNFVKQFLDIATAAPFKEKGIVKALYFDLLAPLVNNIAGSPLAPTSDSNAPFDYDAPFDSILHKEQFNPLLGNLFGRIYAKLKTETGAASCWNAISFTITALRLVPELSVHSIGGVSAELGSSVSYSTSVSTTLDISNENFGLNRFYIDSTGAIKEAGRYYADIKSVTVQDEAGNTVNANTIKVEGATGIIAPEKSKTATVTGTAPATNKVYTFNINYNILANDAITSAGTPSNIVQEGLVARAYLYVTNKSAVESSWDSEIYGSSYAGVRPFYENRDAKENTLITDPTASGYKAEYPTGTVAAPANQSNQWTKSTSKTNQNAYATFPLRYIIGANNPWAYSDLSYRITNGNTSAGYLNVTSIYAYPSAGFEYYDISGVTAVADIPSVEDVTVADGSETDMAFVAVNENGAVLNTKGQVVMTLSEALESGVFTGIVYAETTDEKTNKTIRKYQMIMTDASTASDYGLRLATSIPGVNLEPRTGEKVEVNTADNSLSFTEFSLFSNTSSATTPGEYSFNLQIRVGSRNITVTNVVVDAIGDYNALTNTINNYTNILASYTTSQISNYNTIKAAVIDAVKATAESKVTFDNVSTFLTLDDKRKAIETAYKAATISGNLADSIRTNVALERDNLDGVDYNITTFRAMEDMSRDVEQYVYADDEDRITTPLLENGEPVVDKDGNTIMVNDYDDKGRVQYSAYSTNAQKVLVQEKSRLAVFYRNNITSRGFIGDKIIAEVKHAVSPVDANDNVIGDGLKYSNFTATPVTATRTYVNTETGLVEKGAVDSYRFAYSTQQWTEWIRVHFADGTRDVARTVYMKDDVNAYEISTSLADGTAVKFGAIKNGKLVNEGATVYTDDSWNAYIDALGECITAINEQESVSKVYGAKSHLVIAENRLEEKPATPDGIAISGTVTIATNATGTVGSNGIGGLTVSADGAEEVETAANGSFTIIVPEGTTAITVDGDTAVPRTVTLSGTAAIDDALIPVVVCDYVKDGAIDGGDKIVFGNYYKKPANFNVYGDLNPDGTVDGGDKIVFGNLYKKTINYSALNLD